MKLVIQIPCYNEENDLPGTLKEIPRSVPGFDTVELLIIDDGSTDQTCKVAKENGVHHVLRFPTNQGLANAFSAGIDYALKTGADIIVNTDADNQYPGEEIPKLVAPILAGQADIVIGDRDPAHLPHFSLLKRFFQWMGSWLTRKLSHTAVPDVVSGFRAYSRDAAARMNVISDYSYTVETLIQAGRDRLGIASVPIRVNSTSRPSRLMRSIPSYMQRMALTIIRAYTMYQPLKVFAGIGLVVFILGAALFGRFLYFALVLGESGGHIQSLILGSVLAIIGFQTVLIGLLGDVVSSNRKLIEQVLVSLRKNSSRD